MTNNRFDVTFRGVRGSTPTPISTQEIEEKLLRALEHAKPEDLESAASRRGFVDRLPIEIRGCLGGNSACVTACLDGQNLVFDGGSGFRLLGLEWMKCEFGKGQGQAHIFFSHTHWDHILGVPFFAPFYIKGNRFTICSPHKGARERLEGQQKPQYFPVPFDAFSADLDFVELEGKTEYRVGGGAVTWMEMYHPGKCFSYRVDYKGKSLVYATDSEYKNLTPEGLKPFVDFFRDADLLIFDSQYTFSEGLEKTDWGHSSMFIGVDVAVQANVKKIAFFHHEPTYSDFKLTEIFHQARKYLRLATPKSALEMILAYEGLTIDLMKN